jgi:hypothetical protein
MDENQRGHAMNRREFLKWLAALGGGAMAGYALRGVVENQAAAPPPTPGTAPTGTPPPTQQPAATSIPTSEPEATGSPPPTEARAPTPTPPPWVLPTAPSKLGIHAIRPNNAFPFVRSVTEAGATVPLVKSIGGAGLLREVKSVSPNTVTVGRWPGLEDVPAEGDPRAAAEHVMAAHMHEWAHDPEVVDYWEVLNEPNPGSPEGHAWLARFYIAAMELAAPNGFRLALFSYSTGVPEWRDWAAVVETGVFARARDGGHILALHEYDWPMLRHNWGGSIPDQPAYDPERGVLAGRYRHLYRDFLIPRGEVVPLAITELGLDPGVMGAEVDPYWKQRWLREMAWYDSKITEDDYVLGAALFTLGGGNAWREFDYEGMLPELRDYIVSQHRQYG